MISILGWCGCFIVAWLSESALLEQPCRDSFTGNRFRLVDEDSAR